MERDLAAGRNHREMVPAIGRDRRARTAPLHGTGIDDLNERSSVVEPDDQRIGAIATDVKRAVRRQRRRLDPGGPREGRIGSKRKR